MHKHILLLMVLFLAAVPAVAMDFNDDPGTRLWMIQTSGSTTQLGTGESFFGNFKRGNKG